MPTDLQEKNKKGNKFSFSKKADSQTPNFKLTSIHRIQGRAEAAGVSVSTVNNADTDWYNVNIE